MNSPKKYQLIYAYLRERIDNGDYDKNGRLESETELCARFSTSRLTVRQATQMLEQEGLVSRRKGSGTYVRSAIPPVSANRKRHNRIGLIVPTINDLPYSDFFEVIEENFLNSGCNVLLRSTNHRTHIEREILVEFLELGVDGVIVNGTRSALPNPNAALYEQFRRQGIPVIFFNEAYRELTFPYVVQNDKNAAASLTNYLASLGHKRIACLFALDSIQGHNRYAGYCEALDTNRLGLNDGFAYWYITGEEQAVINSFQPNDCTACICQNDRIAGLLIKHLNELGVQVPEEFSVVGMDGRSTDSMTTALHMTAEISLEAMRMLSEAMKGISPTSRSIEMPIHIGDTAASPKNQNPIINGNWADPFVLKTTDGYYLYPTHRWTDSKFYAFYSENLLHWSGPQTVLDLDAVPWASTNAWSPSVIHYKDMYYMAYTANRQLGFAWCDTPTGSFTNLSESPFLSAVPEVASSRLPLDPHLFIDNEQPYLMYGLSKCWLTPLSIELDRVEVAGNPICLSDRLVTANGEPFAADNKNKFNGCSRLIRIGDRYLFTWSRYDTRDPRCQICYAWADNIEGPFVMPENSVLLKGNDNILGTGHGCIVEHDDTLYLFYHRIESAQDAYRPEVYREVCFDPIHIREDGTLEVIPT